MFESDPHPGADELSRHASFLRALAKGILSDDSLAEDAVQEAFVAAIAQPRVPARGWLSRVTRNAARNILRSETRRAGRERSAARPESTRIDEEATAHVHTQRRVLEAVVGLNEPYRSVIHLRYYRGLTPARIAKLLGVPKKTVESRLTRAHDSLRRRLGGERGSLHWATLLVATGSDRAGVALLGGMLMTKKTVLISVLAFSGVVLWFTFSDAANVAMEKQAGQSVLDGVDLAEYDDRASDPADDGADRRAVAEVPTPVEAGPEADPVDPSEVRLESAIDKMRESIELSAQERLDPGAILDAALLIAAMEPDAPVPELDPGGRMIYPILGLPDGVDASLRVGRKSSRQETLLTLYVSLDKPREPYILEGIRRRDPRVQVCSRVALNGDLVGVSMISEVPHAELVRDARIQTGVFFYSPVENPTEWTLKGSGMTEVPGSAQPDGRVSYQSGGWDLPGHLDGGAWPRLDDMRLLSDLLVEMYDRARGQ